AMVRNGASPISSRWPGPLPIVRIGFPIVDKNETDNGALTGPAFLVPQKPARQIASNEPIRWRTQRACLKPRPTAPSSVHATPDPLRYASCFRTPAQCFGIYTSVRAIRDVQSNLISRGFLELEAVQFG